MNINMLCTIKDQIWWTHNSCFAPQFPRAGGPPVLLAVQKSRRTVDTAEDLSSQLRLSPAYLLLRSMVGGITNASHCIFFTIFLLDIRHYLSSMASSGKPSGPGHLANDPYLCDVCGRAFPTKEEYDTHRLQH